MSQVGALGCVGEKSDCPPDFTDEGGFEACMYMAYDQVGSLKVVADADGNVVNRINYDSFGNILDGTPGFEVPFGFAGGLHDRDTGACQVWILGL